MDNAVDDRHGHIVVKEEFAPIGERLVGGQDDRRFCCVNFSQLQLGLFQTDFRQPMNKIVLRQTDFGYRPKPAGLS
jgi:hypothetical protein